MHLPWLPIFDSVLIVALQNQVLFHHILITDRKKVKVTYNDVTQVSDFIKIRSAVAELNLWTEG